MQNFTETSPLEEVSLRTPNQSSFWLEPRNRPHLYGQRLTTIIRLCGVVLTE